MACVGPALEKCIQILLQKTPMTASCAEAREYAVISPPPERRRVNSQHASGLAESQPSSSRLRKVMDLIHSDAIDIPKN